MSEDNKDQKWLSYPPLVAKRLQLTDLERDTFKLRNDAADVSTRLEAAKKSLEDMESRFILGKATKDDLVQCRQILDHARITANAADRAVTASVGAYENARTELAVIEEEARSGNRDVFLAKYRVMVDCLRDTLQSAADIKIEVEQYRSWLGVEPAGG